MFLPKLHIPVYKWQMHSFHFFGVLGFICGTILGVLVSVKLQLNPYIVLLMSGVGAATFFSLTFLSKWIAGKEVIVYYHHEISIILLCTLALFLIKAPILRYLDISILGIGVFLGFGRIGCYSVGCCHGKPFKQGVKYGQQHVEAGFTWYYKDVPLFPVQLIESLYVSLIVTTGVILLFNDVTPGTVLVCYTVIYGLMRFVLEFFRGDPERPLRLGLSEAQWTTLVLVTITFGMSQAGWLPEYKWHFFILALLLGISSVVILFYRNKTGYLLFTAPHIRQVANGLDRLANQPDGHSPVHPGNILIYTTPAGLNLSCGDYKSGEDIIRHYTLSIKKKKNLVAGPVRKMANLISRLEAQEGYCKIIEKDQGVYHIIFIKHDLAVETKQP